LRNQRLWLLIAVLLLSNCLTVAYFVTKDEKVSQQPVKEMKKEVVAKVGDDVIYRSDWLFAMEKRYGVDVLKELVNEKVIEQVAAKYGVSVTDEEIERELTMIQSIYNPYEQETAFDEETLKRQIKTTLLLEKLMIKDVNIPEEQLKAFYEDNKELYEIPEMYHISHIVVKTNEEALEVKKELEEGSSFSALAMERSIDSLTASRGGEVGYISKYHPHIDPAYLEAIEKLNVGEISDPVPYEEGYAIILLQEKNEGKSFTYDEVKEQIKRQMALQQSEVTFTPESFWEEVGVEWFYGE
jgi:foldase protein PrsA